MRKTLILFALILLISGVAMAQDSPRAEVAGLYSYIRFSGGINCNGGGGSVAYNLNSWIGVVGQVGGCHFSGGNAISYLFGPKLSYRSAGRFDPFAQVLFGGARFSATGFSSNAFAMTAGGGLDIKVSDHFAIRVAQVDYLMTRFAGTRQNNFQYSGGVVFRFGQTK